MTARVAADYTNTSTWTVRRNVQPCGRRGRALIFAIEDVERWMRGAPVARLAPTLTPVPRQVSTTTTEASLGRIRDLTRPRAGGVAADPLADDADSLAP